MDDEMIKLADIEDDHLTKAWDYLEDVVETDAAEVIEWINHREPVLQDDAKKKESELHGGRMNETGWKRRPAKSIKAAGESGRLDGKYRERGREKHEQAIRQRAGNRRAAGCFSGSRLLVGGRRA